MKRRSLLRKFGGSAAALALATQPVVGDKSGRARTIDLDTTRHRGLNEAVVTLFEDARVNVDMDGTRPATPAEAAGFDVIVENHRNAAGQWVPEQATARIEPVPANQIEGDSDSSSGTSTSGSGTSTTSDVGTQSHDGGDSESDYEGGCWTMSKDPINLTLCTTEGWTEWTTSGGDVDWLRWKYHATGCNTSAGTTWYVDDAGHSYTDFYGDYAYTKLYGDYYNWDWSYDSNKTTAHHRLYLTSNADGSLDWSTSHWHNGEDAGLLHAVAGWFSNYDEHTTHC